MTGDAATLPARKQLSEEEIETIKALKMPEVEYPFPIRSCKFAKEASAQAYDWLRKEPISKMYKSTKQRERAISHEMLNYTMYAFPDALEKGAVWGGKFLLWGFALDDHFDADDAFFDKEKSAALVWEMNLVIMWSFPDDALLYRKLVKAVDDYTDDAGQREAILKYVDSKLADARLNRGTIYNIRSPQTFPIVRAIGELWEEVSETCPTHFVHRWGIALQRVILGSFWEVNYRNPNGIPQSTKDYMTVRRETNGLECFFYLAEVAEHKFVPEDAFKSARPEEQRLMETCHMAVTFSNDIWSFPKEALAGDVHNMVIAMHHERTCSWGEAFAELSQKLSDEMAQVDRACEELEKAVAPEGKAWAKFYSKCAKDMVWGFLYWTSHCPRYKK